MNDPRPRATAHLEGFGAGMVREAALASRVQRALERLYRLESVAEVTEYLRLARDGEREALLVRQSEDGAIELLLRVPELGAAHITHGDRSSLDALCQLIEGVSHFVCVTQRASAAGQTSQLELELQAEVDKYVVLVASLPVPDEQASARLRERLFEQVAYRHAEDSERGERYRLANHLAACYTRSLESRFLAPRRYAELHRELRDFFHASREDKLRVARAA